MYAEENKKSNAALGTIFIDNIYTPIKNVKYSIENYRVEQKTDYEKLIIEIVTDGSIHPKEALTEAAKISFTTSCSSPTRRSHWKKRNLPISRTSMRK